MYFSITIIINPFLLSPDVMDDSTTTLIQRFEEEKLLIKRNCLELIKLIGQGIIMLS
jgi:hypothetical protein